MAKCAKCKSTDVKVKSTSAPNLLDLMNSMLGKKSRPSGSCKIICLKCGHESMVMSD